MIRFDEQFSLFALVFFTDQLTSCHCRLVSVISWIVGKLPANISSILDALLAALSLDSTIIPGIFVPTNPATSRKFCEM